MNELEQRVAGLEQSVRRQRLIISGLLLAVVAAVTMAAAPQLEVLEVDAVTAKMFIVKDDEGKSMGVMSYTENGGYMEIHNQAGMRQVRIESIEPGGILQTYSSAGRASVSVGGSSTGRLAVRNSLGKPMAELGVAAGSPESGLLAIYNASTDTQVNITSNDISGTIEISNKSGDVIVQAGADPNGNGAVWVGDNDGKERGRFLRHNGEP